MYRIKLENEYLNIIKKSKFIGLSFYIETKEEAKAYLKELKTKYSDARHICFAYVLKSGEEKQEDDGEPKGTAGIQILDAIKKEALTNILIVVVRYFGGILLGAAGLIHAYKKTAYEVIKISEKTELKTYRNKELTLDYKQYNELLTNKVIKIVDQLFDEEIKVVIEYEEKDEAIVENLIARLKN